MKKLAITLIALCATSVALAFPHHALFQAGSIEDGKTVKISKTSGIASYFQDGKSGYVTFNCNLTGEDSDGTALMFPGKNFSNSQNPAVTKLSSGSNGPYIWHLTDEGDNNGNIRVQYISKGSASLQCQGVYTPA